MRGRDATESSDQRDANPGSAAPSSTGFSGESVIASPGVTTSVSGVRVISLMGDGSKGDLKEEKEGDGVVASSASLRNCGDDADVNSAGRGGRCLRPGLELIERGPPRSPLRGTVALQLRPRPIGLGTQPGWN